MDHLSGDEAVVLFLSAGASFVYTLIAWSRLKLALRLRRNSGAVIAPLLIPPALGLLILYGVLDRWADAEVREFRIYVLLFELLAIAWTGTVAKLLMPLLGIRIRDDAIERGNPATAIVAGGAMLGAILCYAGSNIGGGATIWSTILPAFLATVGWLGLWALLEIAGRASDSIALDRDAASGWRLAGMLVASGLILGRAMAGDYHSAAKTILDFARQAWPALVLLAAAIVMQQHWRPTPQRPVPPTLARGILPCLTMILAAAIYVLLLGSWKKA
jgi:hypothetical protein